QRAVLALFVQVLDTGVRPDAEGREVDFRNTVIILTSNVGTELVMRAVEHGVTVDGEARPPTPEDLVELLRPQLQRAFKPAFLGRLTVIPYYPISDEIMRLIVGLKLAKLKQRLLINHSARLAWDESLVELIVARCTEVDSGARDAEAIITNSVLAEVSGEVLARMAQGQPVRSVDLKVRKGALVVAVK
ncbi:MAG: AAA domain-containing protein, partial [Zoogloea sp.]|nr:AAA domain-containing protein [Zoogloea sp.]